MEAKRPSLPPTAAEGQISVANYALPVAPVICQPRILGSGGVTSIICGLKSKLFLVGALQTRGFRFSSHSEACVTQICDPVCSWRSIVAASSAPPHRPYPTTLWCPHESHRSVEIFQAEQPLRQTSINETSYLESCGTRTYTAVRSFLGVNALPDHRSSRPHIL